MNDIDDYESLLHDSEYTVRPLKALTLQEVARHNVSEDCWVIVGVGDRALVYDVTNYLDNHPGGHEMIMQVAGQNATEWFDRVGHSYVAQQLLRLFAIGKIVDKSQQMVDTESEHIHFRQQMSRTFDLRRSDYLLFVTVPVFLVLFGGVFWQLRRTQRTRAKAEQTRKQTKSPVKK